MPKPPAKRGGIISLDTETTGLDFHHGAKPYFVTMGHENGTNTWWEWMVDPRSREPLINQRDLVEIQEEIDQADTIVLQNPKFDVAALQTIFKGKLRWDWSKVRDTLRAGHLLASSQPHDLTTMALVYLDVNIAPYEQKLKLACTEARREALKKFPDWQLAQKGREDMPSAKESVWMFDAWLPLLMAMNQRYSQDHPWRSVLREYGNADSTITLPLYLKQEQIIKERGLWLIYLECLKIPSINHSMEDYGITISQERLDKQFIEYQSESEKAGETCVGIAKQYNYDLTLPKSGNNNSLINFITGPLNLKSPKVSKKTGKPSLDKNVLEEFEVTLNDGPQLEFIKNLRSKRKRDTALQYMEGYQRFWLPTVNDGWYRLHPSLNPTGTDTLRWSSQNPNEQNISKTEGFNLRYMFGPAPGREWWSIDAENIELRIPAYESGEREMVDLFDRVSEPPYFGSYHLLIFDTLHPEKFAKHGVKCKDIYASTWYQWTKNGNFAVTYGAVESSGTADRAYHVPGAHKRIKERFSSMAKLNQKQIDHAEKYGYVETIPDRSVDPSHGYPLLCTRSNYGRILPTVPLNYHVQGTAMWWMMKAMIRCCEYLGNHPGADGHMVMQVHDEIVFDFPKSTPIQFEGKNKGKPSNLMHIEQLKLLMAQGGEDIGVPTPVSCKYHAETWSEGVKV